MADTISPEDIKKLKILYKQAFQKQELCCENREKERTLAFLYQYQMENRIYHFNRIMSKYSDAAKDDFFSHDEFKRPWWTLRRDI